MVLLKERIQGLLREGRLGDRFLVRRVGSANMEELMVTHLLENGLWIFMDPKEKQQILRFGVDLEQVLPMGVKGGLPKDVGRLGGRVVRMGRVYSERARDKIFAEAAEIALAYRATPPAPPEPPPPEAPIWDFRAEDPNWRSGTDSDGIRRGNPRLPVRRRMFREKGPADVDGNPVGAKIFPMSKYGATAKAAPRRRVPPGGDSGDAEEAEAAIVPVGGPDKAGWFLAEPCEGYDVGTDVTAHVLGGTVTGLHALVLLQGICVRAECMDVTEVFEWKASRLALLRDLLKLPVVGDGTAVGFGDFTPGGTCAKDKPQDGVPNDARIFGVHFNHTGKAYRSYAEAVELLGEDPIVGWDITGPRTYRFCAMELAKTGMGAVARSQKWRHENGISTQDAVGLVHELLSEIEEIGLCKDQLDLSNLQCFERLIRHRQFIEESYRQKLEEKKLEKGDSLSMCADYFAGRPRMAGGAIVSPDLIEYVSKMAAADAEILKQQRKALEFRQSKKK